MPSRRLEDRIRELCAKLIKAEDQDFESASAELKGALHEHTERLRKVVAQNLLKKEQANRRKID
jgi:hypothetical protein